MLTVVNGVEFERTSMEKPDYIPVYDGVQQQAWAWMNVYIECSNDEEFKQFSLSSGYTGAQAVTSYIRYLRAKSNK